MSVSVKEQRELARLERLASKPQSRIAYFYLLFLLSLIYIIDEVTSNISGTVQSNIVNEFFVLGKGLSFNEGLAALGAISNVMLIVMVFAPFYKALSDRFGRKIFLYVNTIGMGAGLFICYLSTSLPVFVVGMAISMFFISHDMQVVYIMEVAPPKWRATLYSVIKCIASVGIVLIPVLRAITMGDNGSMWRTIFIFPAALGVIVGLAAMMTAPESPQFLKDRIKYLKRTPQERLEAELKNREGKNAQKGGILRAFRFMFRHKQLRWLAIVNAIFFLSAAAIRYYEPIMSTGGMSTSDITRALFVFPFFNAGLTLINGFLCDRFGRKATSILMSGLCLTGFVLFVLGIGRGWAPYLIGALYGLYIGGFNAAGDVIGGIMCGESAPTHLRASVIAAQTLILLISYLVSNVVLIIALPFVKSIGMLCLSIAAPCMLAGLVIFTLRVKDTKGLDLGAVTGTEWD